MRRKRQQTRTQTAQRGPRKTVTDHALSHGHVVVLAELDEEVEHVEGGGGGEGLQALEALEAHLVAEHPHVQRALQLVQLGVALPEGKGGYIISMGYNDN